MERDGCTYCTNYHEREAVCPKSISIDFIARLNRDFLHAKERAVPRRAVGLGPA
ncbi:MAG TPA: hypothetical protein VHG32_06025 [Thermoanaerobaculia bacterium]|jgi:succinate dehydrogenase / fumarate reductase iron-sulfur subunit|nr:hypothetical protein [Thermoanaerobaculia bacterium]